MKPYQVRWVAAGAAALILMYLYIIFVARPPLDHRIFWTVGRDLWDGLDPYDPARFAENPFLNPPTALPLFALFAALPYRPSLVIWTLANVLIGLALSRPGDARPCPLRKASSSLSLKDRALHGRLPRE